MQYFCDYSILLERSRSRGFYLYLYYQQLVHWIWEVASEWLFGSIYKLLLDGLDVLHASPFTSEMQKVNCDKGLNIEI